MKSIKFKCTKEQDQNFVTFMSLSNVQPDVDAMYRNEHVLMTIYGIEENTDVKFCVMGWLGINNIKYEVLG